MTKAMAIGVAGVIVLMSGCEREERDFDRTALRSNPRAQADGMADLQPGQPGRGMRPTASAGPAERIASRHASTQSYEQNLVCLPVRARPHSQHMRGTGSSFSLPRSDAAR